MKAVIMAGGRGTRFWPLSRIKEPKQFLRILDSRTMLQETVARVQPLLAWSDIYVVCGRGHVEQIGAQLPELTRDQIIVEPAGKSTAPCIGLAAVYLSHHDSGEVMTVLPSDHAIKDLDEFQRVLQAGEALAREGWLVTFGIQPTHAATGYGYLLKGEKIGEFGGESAYRVDRFTEKPNRLVAEEFLEAGNYYWNSGTFVWTINRILEEINICLPKLGGALEEIGRNWNDTDQLSKIFGEVDTISIDVGVMEKAEKVAMLPCCLGWSDVGSWKTLVNVLQADSQGVISNTSHVNIDGRDCILYSAERKLVALLGVEDLVIVETRDALLICSMDRSEEVRKIVEYLEDNDLKHYL